MFIEEEKTRKQLLKSRTREHTVEVKNKFDDAGVEEFVTIASKKEDKFAGSVSECAAKFTVIVKQKNPSSITSAEENKFIMKKEKTLVKPLPTLKSSTQVQAQQVRGVGPDVDGGGARTLGHLVRRDACGITLCYTRLQLWR